MPNKAFSTLVSRIQPHVPQCPHPVIVNHVRDAAIKACERSLAWRYEVPTFRLLPGVHEYAFEVPTNAEVHAVIGFTVNDSLLVPLNLDTALAQYPEWADLFSGEDAEELWSETPGGYINAPAYNEEVFNGGSDFELPDSIVAEGSTPEAYTVVSPQRYVVLPLPDGDTYIARQFLALKPLRTATDMDEQAMNELEDSIFHKTCEDLMFMQKTPWFNPDLAIVHGRKYASQSLERRARSNLGHVRGSLGARSRPWV